MTITKLLTANDKDIKVGDKTYSTALQMCYENNTNLRTINNRLKGGLNLEEALQFDFTQFDNIIKNRSIPIKDHNGNEYKSLRSMLFEYKIPMRVFKTKILEGKSVEEITESYEKNNNSGKVIKEAFELDLDQVDERGYKLYKFFDKKQNSKYNDFHDVFYFAHKKDDNFIVITEIKTPDISDVVIPQSTIIDGKELTIKLPSSCNGLFEDSNISSFDSHPMSDTSNVISYKNMFKNCKNLREVDLRGLFLQGKTVDGMLKEATLSELKITGEQLTTKEFEIISSDIKSVTFLRVYCKNLSEYETTRWYDNIIKFLRPKKTIITIA